MDRTVVVEVNHTGFTYHWFSLKISNIFTTQVGGRRFDFTPIKRGPGSERVTLRQVKGFQRRRREYICTDFGCYYVTSS